MDKDTEPTSPTNNSRSAGTTTPLVSVIIPVYNRAGHIQRSVQSVLRQTYQQLEIIVVDDGSTDGTVEQIRALADFRIRVITLTSNRGANAARNIGIEAAAGDWIAFQDSDDEWKPDKLKKQVSACLHQKTLVAFSGMNRHAQDSIQYIPKPEYRIQPSTANRLNEVLGARFISNQTLLAHRKVFLAIGGYDESLQRLQDWELSIRIAEKFPITYVSEALVEAYIMPDSITSRESIFNAIQQILDKHARLFASDRVSLGIQQLSLCLHALSGAHYGTAFECLFLAIRKCKFQLLCAAYRLVKRR